MPQGKGGKNAATGVYKAAWQTCLSLPWHSRLVGNPQSETLWAARMPPQSGATVEKPEPGQLFTWDEIGLRSGKGNAKENRWLVINRKVYDISQFHWRHPGGTRIISHYAGQDATVRPYWGVGSRWGTPYFNSIALWFVCL